LEILSINSQNCLFFGNFDSLLIEIFIFDEFVNTFFVIFNFFENLSAEFSKSSIFEKKKFLKNFFLKKNLKILKTAQKNYSKN